MLQLLLTLAAGCGVGVITGLLPGLHPNSVIFLLLPVYFELRPSPLVFVAFATGMSTVHTFTSFIPSVFVGAPEGDTALAALPGHQLLHAGRGREAVELTVAGGVIAATLAVVLLPLIFLLVPPVYAAVSPSMHLLLVALLGYILLTADNTGAALAIIFLAGALGLAALHSPLSNTQYILFPVFAGLFGVSIVVESLAARTSTPAQGRSLPVRPGDVVPAAVIGLLGGMIAGFIPGIGSSQSILAVERSGSDIEDFLVALGGVTTTDLFFSLAALYLIGNPRSGAAVAMQQVLPRLDLAAVLQVLGMSMTGVGIGAIITRRSTARVVGLLQRINYRRLLWAVVAFVVLGSGLLNGVFGVLVLVTATALGVLTARLGLRRSTCMAVLIVPTVLHYTGIDFARL